MYASMVETMGVETTVHTANEIPKSAGSSRIKVKAFPDQKMN